MSDTRISIFGGVLVAGIPRIRTDSTAPRTGRMERTSRGRFRRACRTWNMEKEAEDWCGPTGRA